MSLLHHYDTSLHRHYAYRKSSMESFKYYENIGLKQPKQLNIVVTMGALLHSSVCIRSCKNAHYDKYCQKTNIGWFEFLDNDAKPEL